MFLVDPKKHSSNVRRIRRWLNTGDPALAAIVSAIYLEWSLARFVLIFSELPLNQTAEAKNLHVSSPSKYEELFKRSFKESGLEPGDVIANWGSIKNPEKVPNLKFNRTPKDAALQWAILTRNELVHGRSGTVSFEVAKFVVTQFLGAIEDLESFAQAHGESLFNRLKNRRDKADPQKKVGYRPREDVAAVLRFLDSGYEVDKKSGKPKNRPDVDKRTWNSLVRTFGVGLKDTNLDLLKRRLEHDHFPCKLCSSYRTTLASQAQPHSPGQNIDGKGHQASGGLPYSVTTELPPPTQPVAFQ